MPPPTWDDAGSIAATMAAVSKLGLLQAGSPEPGLIEEYMEIPMRDGHMSRTKVYRPTQRPAAGSPLILHIYGGGWISGDCDISTPMCRAWARLFGAVIVSISYRLAPEHKWPVPWNDAWDNAVWIAEHASDLHADPSQGFVVGGVSAGAGLSAFITSQSQTDSLAHPITGQWLSVPAIMNPDAVPEKYKPYHRSMVDNQDAPILPASALASLKRHIEWDSASPMRYPVLCPTEVMARLPRTYLQACGMDCIRDDALIYHEMLREAGVDAKVDLYDGCPHAHFAFMPGLEVSEGAERDILVNMGWLLGSEVSVEEAKKAMVKPEV